MTHFTPGTLMRRVPGVRRAELNNVRMRLIVLERLQPHTPGIHHSSAIA
jgi:hypothetical protein